MSRLTQIASVTAMNLRSLPARKGPSIVAVVGIAGVVAVLTGILSIREGFRAVLDLSGRDDVTIVLRGGSTAEMSSGLTQEETRLIADAPGVVLEDGEPIASAELYVIVDVPLVTTGTPANVPMRGVGPYAPDLRQDFRIVSGRMFNPGTSEAIVGSGASRRFADLQVGETLRSGNVAWDIVGTFEDDGSVAESEVWTDAVVLQGAYNRGTTYQSVRVMLTGAGALGEFVDALTTDPRLNTRVYTERDYYVEQSSTLVTLVDILGQTIAVFMGLAAVFGALNTMYSAVSGRTREIATLLALGFGALPVVASVLVEAMLLGAVGGVLGSLIAYVGFNGMQASTINFASFSQVTFAFLVTPGLVLQGVLYALALGFIGGLLPSLRAARLPVVVGLRAT